MRSDVSQLCWKNSRLSWRKSRNSRVGCQKCLFLNTLHHILRNFTERHLLYYLVWWMQDKVQVWSTPLDYPKVFWSLVGLILRMSWQKKPHRHHIVNNTMCILLQILRRDLHLPPQNFLRGNNLEPAIILPHIHPVMRWRWWCRNSTNCMNPKLTNWRVGTWPWQTWSFSHGWKI